MSQMSTQRMRRLTAEGRALATVEWHGRNCTAHLTTPDGRRELEYTARRHVGEHRTTTEGHARREVGRQWARWAIERGDRAAA